MRNKWTDLYKNYGYNKEYEKFLKKMKETDTVYCDLSSENLQKAGHEYFDFFEKTMGILKIFLENNLLFSSNTSDIINHILSKDILNNGLDLYYLYRGMKNLKRHKFVLPKRYLVKKYLNIFTELNDFFLQRIKKEKEYELVG